MDYPVMYVTQVPVTETQNTVVSISGAHLATTKAAPRGGALMIRYPDGTVKNLTALAGYGEQGMLQGGRAIAVRDPSYLSDGRLMGSFATGPAITGSYGGEIQGSIGSGFIPEQSKPFLIRVSEGATGLATATAPLIPPAEVT